MHVSFVISETRYPERMKIDEIQLALRHARALAALGPPREISVALATFTAELLRELGSRNKADDDERQLSDFSPKELRAAIEHARALCALRPRQGIQQYMNAYVVAVVTEQENRREDKKNRIARISKGLADNGAADATEGIAP
jgi:hypothetical protein